MLVKKAKEEEEMHIGSSFEYMVKSGLWIFRMTRKSGIIPQ